MTINPKYIVVKKIIFSTEIFLSKEYIDNYQMCEVVTSDIFNEGDKVLVTAQCFFDKADIKEAPFLRYVFGQDALFMYADDVFGVIRNNKIIPVNNIVYIEADKDKKSKISIGGKDMFVDTSYNPLATENVVQDGIVYSVCLEARDSYFSFPLKIEVESGDKVYTHHFLTHQDAEREFNGKKYYETLYENLYCKIVGGVIIMLNEWNFISSIDLEIENVSGVDLDLTKKKEFRTGIVEHLSNSLRERKIQKGDKIVFKKGREYLLQVEGMEFYRISTNDIIYQL